jgi:glutathione S-transferase
MKLYTYDSAPNPQRLAMFMKYKGIELETHVVDMAKAEQLTDEYRAINPDGTVPALILEDGTVLSQVIGMCVYLEEIYPEKPLMGTTALEKAQVISWVHKLGNSLFMGVASVFRNRSKGFVDRALPGPLNLPQIPEMVDRGLAQVRYALPLLNEHLSHNTWMAGDNFTFADIDLLTAMGFLGWIKEPVPEDLTHLQEWMKRAQAEVA